MTGALAEPEGPLGVPGGGKVTDPGPGRTRAVLDSLDEVVFQTDAVGNWTYLNQAWTKVTGHLVEDTLGRPFLDFVHPDERDDTLALFGDVISSGRSHCHHTTRYLRADGSAVWVDLRASVLRGPGGDIVGNAGTIVDVTQRHEAESALAEQSEVLEMIARGSPLEEVFASLTGSLAPRVGADVHLRTAEPSTRAPLLAARESDGCRAGATAAGARIDAGDLADGGTTGLTSDRRALFPVAAGEVAVGALTFHHPDPAFAVPPAGRDLAERAARLASIAIMRDRALHEVRHRAFHDHLTGLPNRALAADRLDQALRRADRLRTWVALVLVDLDHFKHVNDIFGHELGDRLLGEVASRLSAAVGGRDTVARLGGDEFVVVLDDLRGAADAETRAAALLATLDDPVAVGDTTVAVTASVGVALARGATKTVPELFREADVAMYRAKQGGSVARVFDQTFDDARLDRIDLSADLDRAIGADDLFLRYQPKLDLRTGRTTGLEALVRWDHGQRGILGPDEFIPMAEATGAINALTMWVLRAALAEAHRWSADGSAIPVAVNVPVPMLQNLELPDLVAAALADAGLSAHLLELEITESAVMANASTAQRVMSRLVDAGVRFAIDDFGTGHSSLAYLKHLPVATLKIDRAFAADVADDDRDAAIVGSIIDLGHNLGMEVLAEGVETQEVCDRLTGLGCDTAQGFYFARPLDAGAVPAWLASRATRSAPVA